MWEDPITFFEATKILGCMHSDLLKAADEGRLILTKGDRPKITAASFRRFCKEEQDLSIDRLPEKRGQRRDAAPRMLSSKKATKKMKRKGRSKKASLRIFP